MYITFRKVAIIGAIVGMLILTVALIYTHNLATYTASIDNRPFKAGLVGSVDSLDPALITEHEEQLIASALYEGLVYYDEKNGSIKPLLAKSWKYSSDGKSLTIKLKQNVKFHNNQKVTAQKVKAAWEKSFSSCKDLSKTTLFLSVAGAADCLKGSQTIAGIEAVNDLTLKISFAVPDSAFLYKLCNPIFWVYDIQKETTAPQPGTGPFTLTDNKDNKQILLIGNTNYHRGIPRLSAIDFTVFTDEVTAYQSYTEKKLDYLDKIPLSEIKKIRQNEQLCSLFIDKPLMEIYVLGLNVNKEPFTGDYMLRRALNYAIDRNQISEDIFGGNYVPIKGVIPPEVKGYSSEMPGYVFNPEKAKKLMEEAGYPEGAGLKTIILSYNSDEGHQMVAEAIAEQLSPLGISVQLQPMEWEYFKKQMQQSAMTMFRVGWVADYPDADSFLYGLFHSAMAGKGNYTGYHNPQVDKILDAARAETKSNAERLKLLGRAEEIIVDDAPFLWLFQKKSAVMIGSQTNCLTMNRMGMVDWYAVELIKPEFNEQNTSV